MGGPRAAALGCALAALLSFSLRSASGGELYGLFGLLMWSLAAIVSVESPAWRTAASIAPAAVFLAAQLLFGSARLSPLRAFIVFSAYSGFCAMCGRSYWQMRRAKDRLKEQYLRERAAAELNARLLRAATMEELCALAVQSIYETTGCPAVLFLPSAKGGPQPYASFPEGLMLYPRYEAAAECLRSCAPAGRGTGICEGGALCCLPVLADGKALAAAGLLAGNKYDKGIEPLGHVEELLIRLGVAMERLRAVESAQKNEMEKELEHIRTDLLRSISHDLRTPLTGIIGACSALEQLELSRDEETRRALIEGIGKEAEWLLRMVENLLSVTRACAGAPKLRMRFEALEEVLAEVLEKARSRYPQIELRVSLPDELVLVPMDPNLIVQVLINLIDNAAKYSPRPSVVELSAEDAGDCVRISVADCGKGLSEEELSVLFEALPQRAGDSNHGMGLGLSICRSIIAAHGGTIEGRNRQPKGAVFTVTLPKEASA